MGVERQARSTSGVHNINSDELKAIAIRVPPIPTQHAVIDTVNKISSRIDDLEFCTDAELKRCAALQQAILGEAFSGQLVAQNPEDEPASALLERIHAERDGATRKKERTAKNGKKKAA
jgi:type I restriction enzyme, S subunit